MALADEHGSAGNLQRPSDWREFQGLGFEGPVFQAEGFRFLRFVDLDSGLQSLWGLGRMESRVQLAVGLFLFCVVGFKQ